MVEYLYNTIRAAAGDSVTITAKVTDTAGAIVVDGCSLCLYDGNTKLLDVAGTLDGTVWNFTIDGEATAALAGRYWYKVCDCNHNSLDFAQPIYFVTRGTSNGSDAFERGREFEQARLKPDLKAAIEERGAVITRETNIDEYADILRSCPYIASGTFTPEEDSTRFEVKDLGFEPSIALIFYWDEAELPYDTIAVSKIFAVKDGKGFMRIKRTTGKFGSDALYYVPEGNSWIYEMIISKDKVVLDFDSSVIGFYKAGYTYNYIIA